MRAPLVAAAAMTALLVTGEGRAAEPGACGAPGRPWVEVHAAEELPRPLRAFVDLLRAELRSRGFELCTTGGQGGDGPLATIEVRARPGTVSLDVEVRDALTSKRVSREVALAGIPPDGQPLTVALAADELLRASWAELQLRTAPPPPQPVPVQVSEVVRDAIRSTPPSPPHFQMGIGFSWEQYAHGALLYGPDGRLGVWIDRRFEAALRFGLRTGPTTTAADGVVQPSAWSVGAAGIYTFTPSGERWGVDGVARFDVERLELTPTPSAAATGSEKSDYALLASLGPQAWFAVVPALRIGLELLGAIPLRGVDATDANSRVVGIGGLGWSAQLGVWSGL
jgi:hypothetical protein